jgi:hypothetical protein
MFQRQRLPPISTLTFILSCSNELKSLINTLRLSAARCTHWKQPLLSPPSRCVALHLLYWSRNPLTLSRSLTSAKSAGRRHECLNQKQFWSDPSPEDRPYGFSMERDQPITERRRELRFVPEEAQLAATKPMLKLGLVEISAGGSEEAGDDNDSEEAMRRGLYEHHTNLFAVVMVMYGVCGGVFFSDVGAFVLSSTWNRASVCSLLLCLCLTIRNPIVLVAICGTYPPFTPSIISSLTKSRDQHSMGSDGSMPRSRPVPTWRLRCADFRRLSSVCC